MTGFGRSRRVWKDKTVIAEVKSLNSKVFDLRSKTPLSYRSKESDFRRIVAEKLERGKIDLVLEIQTSLGAQENLIDKQLFGQYHRELSQMQQSLGLPPSDLLPAILRLPGVVAGGEEDISAEEWETVVLGLHEAMDALLQFQETEGRVIQEDMACRIQIIQDALSAVTPYEEDRIHRVRIRLQENLTQSAAREKIDENRFEQEIIYFLERMDFSEEKVRLAQHCHYFLQELASSDISKGRKLGFISQEIGREINTLGAKANHVEIQKLVVTMKDELEKIKEQVANVR